MMPTPTTSSTPACPAPTGPNLSCRDDCRRPRGHLPREEAPAAAEGARTPGPARGARGAARTGEARAEGLAGAGGQGPGRARAQATGQEPVTTASAGGALAEY